jgi:hypothetical protein
MSNYGNMRKRKVNILVVGLLQTGSSAMIDFLREFENIHIIPDEFNDYRAPGLVADRLYSNHSDDFPIKIDTLLKFKRKISLLYQIFPILNWESSIIIGFCDRFKKNVIRIKQLSLLKKLNIQLSASIPIEEKIEYANQWITEVGNINSGNKEFVVFNQPILNVNETRIWKKVFNPWKLIIVYRDPKDQLAEIIKKGNLCKLYGAPVVNFGGVALETLYGRSQKGAIAIHIKAIKKRFEWIDSLKKELDKDEFLLIDFEGLINNYNEYKTVIENFIGNLKHTHRFCGQYFDPKIAKKNIGIYKEYLDESDLDSLGDLENWYNNMIKSNMIN